MALQRMQVRAAEGHTGAGPRATSTARRMHFPCRQADTRAGTRTSRRDRQSELRQKDGRLRQLRAAIKALEGKLAELLRDKTDLWVALGLAASGDRQQHCNCLQPMRVRANDCVCLVPPAPAV